MLITRPNPTPASESLRTDDLFVLDALHRAFALQGRTLLAVARQLVPTDAAEATAALEWFDHARSVIDRHVRVVDEVLVPTLTAHVGADPSLEWAMAGSGDEVCERTARVAAALGGLVGLAELSATQAGEWQVQTVVAAVDALVVSLDDRVARERELLVPRLLTGLPVAAFDELRGELVLGVDPSLVPYVLPWLTSMSDPADAERLVHQLPRVVRGVHRYVWAPAHDRTYPQFALARRRVQRGLVEPGTA